MPKNNKTEQTETPKIQLDVLVTEVVPTVPEVTPEPTPVPAEIEVTIPSAVPPKLFKRNEYGLIADESIRYFYKEDGKIDWRKMIKPEFLVPHKQVFARQNKPVPDSIEGLADNELLILLGGIKDLARLRGYTDVRPTVTSPSSDCVLATCVITWIPNYEENMIVQSFGDGADATPFNCNGFGKNYLTTIACNRAFVRAVRNYLGVNIVSQEEIGGNTQAESTEGLSSNLLGETMTKFGVTFEKIKAKLIEENVQDADKFNTIDDIPRYKQFELIERIKKKAAAAGKQ